MKIQDACRVFGFTTPPLEKQILKRRYLQLIRRHHPDRGGPDASTTKIVEVTEAYRCLKTLLEERVGAGSGAGAASGGGVQYAEVFRAPGFGAATEGMWLPWQKSSPSTPRAKGPLRSSSESNEMRPSGEPQPSCGSTTARNHSEAGERGVISPASCRSFREYVHRVRTAARREAEQRAAAQERATGSHGFTAAHLEHQRRMRQRQQRSNGGDHMDMKASWLSLAARYGLHRWRSSHRTLLNAVRFVVTGR